MSKLKKLLAILIFSSLFCCPAEAIPTYDLPADDNSVCHAHKCFPIFTLPPDFQVPYVPDRPLVFGIKPLVEPNYEYFAGWEFCPPTQNVPEPASMLLLVSGMVPLARRFYRP